MRMDGKVGIVTGGGRGIGRACALDLARHGAKVVVNDLGASLDGRSDAGSPADEVAAEILAAGGEAAADGASVCDWDAVQSMVDRAVARWGRLDFVVHSAGIVRDALFHKVEPEDVRAVLDVHLVGGFYVSMAAARHFRAAGGGGSIVHMTSTSGLVGTVGQSTYAAAKLGLVGLIRSIALDMRKFDVRCNGVAPFAWTRMTESIPLSEDPVLRRRREALERLKPEDVAPLVSWLCSSDSAPATGQVMAVRGAEIVLFDLPHPSRNIHRQGGWTPEALSERLGPLIAAAGVPLRTTPEVFGYPPLE